MLGKCDVVSEQRLSGYCLQYANLQRANLYEANLYQADLYKANLQEAILCNANLGEANLCYANLARADLRGANLAGADLEGATIADDMLARVTSLDKAVMPNGEIYDPEIHTFEHIVASHVLGTGMASPINDRRKARGVTSKSRFTG
jgi:hypothetical protein